MRRLILGACVAAMVLGAVGCAYNSMVSTGSSRTDMFFGDVGITGDNNNVTVLRGSKLHKLSFIGNNNTVTVQEGVTVTKIEFWGKGNTVSLPEDLVVRTTEVGDNQIIRRPRAPREPVGYTPYDYEYAPPPTVVPRESEPLENDVLLKPPPMDERAAEPSDWNTYEPAELPPLTDPNALLEPIEDMPRG